MFTGSLRLNDRAILAITLTGLSPFVFISFAFYWPADDAILVSSLSMLLLLLFAFALFRVRDAGITQPALVFFITVFLGYFGKVFYLLFASSQLFLIEKVLLLWGVLGEQKSGVLIITISACVFLIAYILPANKNIAMPIFIRQWFHAKAAFYIAILLLIISASSFLSYFLLNYDAAGAISGKRFGSDGGLPSERFSDFGYYLFKSTLVVKFALYVFLLCYFSAISNIKRYLSLIGVVISAMFFIFVSSFFSNRAGIVVAALDLFIISYLLSGKVKLLKVLLIGGVVIIVILMISSLRSDLGSQKSLLDHVFGGRYFFEISRNTHLYNYLSSGNSLFVESQSVLGFIKQYVNLGRVSGEEVFLTKGSGVPLGFPMEMFAFGGWGLLLVAMATIGFIMRKLCNIVTVPVLSDYRVVIYSIIVTRMMIYLFNNGLGVMIYQVVIDLIPFLFIVALVKPPQRFSNLRIIKP